MRKIIAARPLARLLAAPLALAGVVAATSAVTASAGTSATTPAPVCLDMTGVLPTGPAVHLTGVTVLTACSAFAVGGKSTVDQWDGADWNQQQIAAPANSTSAGVSAVTGLSTTNVYAAGSYTPSSSGTAEPLIEHWNGSAWSVSAAPVLTTGSGNLTGVAASAAADVWAVGANVQGANQVGLTEHWNGTAWAQVPTANPTSHTTLAAVAAVSPTSAWLVGSSLPNSGGSVSTAFIQHWDGTSWTVAPSPALPSNSQLVAVNALSASNVWAVGQTTAASGATKTVTEHYDGTSWTLVPSPTPGTSAQLTGVSITSTGVVASGYYFPSGASQQTLLLRLDSTGTSWTQIPTPTLGGISPQLLAIDGTSGNYWAVGGLFNNGGASVPIALHCGC